jgi:hypothetical protein
MNPSDEQLPVPESGQLPGSLSPGDEGAAPHVAKMVQAIVRECRTGNECWARLDAARDKYYHITLIHLRTAPDATADRERSWSSTASKAARSFLLTVLVELIQALYADVHRALHETRGGLAGTVGQGKEHCPHAMYELYAAAQSAVLIQDCKKDSTPAACKRFVEVLWNRLMLGHALKRVIEAWTQKVEENLLGRGMTLHHVREMAGTIERENLDDQWGRTALAMFGNDLKREMKQIPESHVTSLLEYAPLRWDDHCLRALFERKATESVMIAVIERQGHNDFIAETQLVANMMGTVFNEVVPSNTYPIRGGALIVMKKFQPGKVKCHAKICADEAWKSKLVLA